MNLPKPLNAEEKYLYATVARLETICEMLSTIVDRIGEKEDVVDEEVVVESTSAKDDKCKGITLAGVRCKSTAKEGSDYCAIHGKE